MFEYSYEKKFDVVIIGAGVIGCSIAYYLARKSDGKLKVGVIERNTIGEESSYGASGMLAAQIESESGGPFLDLCLESRKSYAGLSKELKEISGIDIEHVQSGILSIAFDEDQDEKLKDRLVWQRKALMECDWWTREQIQEKFPFLQADFLGGLWVPQDGQVRSSQVVSALAESASKLGVEFYENESVEDLPMGCQGLDFIESNVSKFVAGKFVFAAGAWTGKLLNNQVRVKPAKGQLLMYKMPPVWSASRSWNSPVYCGTTPEPDSIQCYLVPKRDGSLLVGGTVENRGFDKSKDEKKARILQEYASLVFPDLASFQYLGSWEGLRPATDDRLPVMGPLPGTRNIYVASGHFRNGILLAPITGEIMSDLIIKGKPGFDIGPFSPQRFFHSA